MTIPRTDQACGSLSDPNKLETLSKRTLEIFFFFLGEGKTITCIADVI